MTTTMLWLLVIGGCITALCLFVSWWQDERRHKRAERQVDEFLRERGE